MACITQQDKLCMQAPDHAMDRPQCTDNIRYLANPASDKGLSTGVSRTRSMVQQLIRDACWRRWDLRQGASGEGRERRAGMHRTLLEALAA
jgi:hypothetical protein